MDLSSINPDILQIASIREVGDFNSYYRENIENMTKLKGLANGAEGHYIGAPFLRFGFRRFDEPWPGHLSPDFEADIPKKVFLDLGYPEGEYLERLTGFLEFHQFPSKLFIARQRPKELSKADYRELDAMWDYRGGVSFTESLKLWEIRNKKAKV